MRVLGLGASGVFGHVVGLVAGRWGIASGSLLVAMVVAAESCVGMLRPRCVAGGVASRRHSIGQVGAAALHPSRVRVR